MAISDTSPVYNAALGYIYPKGNISGTVYSKIPGNNQFTPKTLEEIIAIKEQYPKFRPKDFIGEGTLNDVKKGGKKLLTRNDIKKAEAAGVKFPTGKIIFKPSSKLISNKKYNNFIREAQGSMINMDKVNNFGHFAPKLKTFLTSTANTGPIGASVNRAAQGYDSAILKIAEEQEKLLLKKPKGYEKLLEIENSKGAKLSRDYNKLLPKELKGTLGYFTVSPEGDFKLKGVDKAKTFAGISEKEKFYKTDMTTAERTAFGKEQSSKLFKEAALKEARLGGPICNPFRNKGGRIGFANGTSCAVEVSEALKNDPKKFAQDVNKTEGVIPKVKNAATRFLQGFKTSGSLRGKVALGAGAVIGGGGAAALVRQFRSDDKSTYLTNDRQMEGMIIADDIERDLEDMGFILDNEGKIELAATGALSASMVKQVYNAARAGEAQLLEMPTELDQEARALRKTIDEIIRTPLSKKQLARKAFLKNNLKAYLEIQKNYPKQYDDLQRRAMDDKIKMTQDELKRLVPKKVKRITESGQQVIRESRDRLNQIENLAKDTKLRGTTGDLVNPGKSGRLMSALGLRKGVLGLGLNAFMSPAIALPTAAMSVARDIKSGKSTEDTLTNPFTYLPTAFMKSGMKGLAKMGATRGLMGVAGLGLGSVAAAPVVGALSIAGGLATLGSMGYQGYKMFKDRNKTDEGFYN